MCVYIYMRIYIYIYIYRERDRERDKTHNNNNNNNTTHKHNNTYNTASSPARLLCFGRGKDYSHRTMTFIPVCKLNISMPWNHLIKAEIGQNTSKCQANTAVSALNIQPGPEACPGEPRMRGSRNPSAQSACGPSEPRIARRT